MLFNSLAFAIFLPIVFFLYWALPSKYRSFFLLIVSYYFYMSWNVKYVVLILFTTVLSYGCARLLEKYPAHKKLFLWLTVAACMSVLFFFKYYNRTDSPKMCDPGAGAYAYPVVTCGYFFLYFPDAQLCDRCISGRSGSRAEFLYLCCFYFLFSTACGRTY